MTDRGLACVALLLAASWAGCSGVAPADAGGTWAIYPDRARVVLRVRRQ